MTPYDLEKGRMVYHRKDERAVGRGQKRGINRRK
jgi:hypothetical protein